MEKYSRDEKRRDVRARRRPTELGRTTTVVIVVSPRPCVPGSVCACVLDDSNRGRWWCACTANRYGFRRARGASSARLNGPPIFIPPLTVENVLLRIPRKRAIVHLEKGTKIILSLNFRELT